MLNQFEGTPGPWYPINYGGFVSLQTVPNYTINNDILNEEHDKNADKNGQLISCAPEMLDELSIIYHSIIGGGRLVTFQDHDIERIKSILEKALGKEVTNA